MAEVNFGEVGCGPEGEVGMGRAWGGGLESDCYRCINENGFWKMSGVQVEYLNMPDGARTGILQFIL